MQVHKIDNARPAFGAKLVKSSALENYKAGLSDIQRDIFESRNAIVEAVKDGKEYIYSVFEGPKKIASIMEVSKNNGGVSFLPRYSGYEDTTDSLFELLYNEYKELHKKAKAAQENEIAKKINIIS